MPYSIPTDPVPGATATAANFGDPVRNSLIYLQEVAYVEYTADVSVTATTVGTANQIVSAGAITYENVPHMIEFYCPSFGFAANSCNIILRDSTTVLGTIARTGASGENDSLVAWRRLTPSAASHTYNIAAWLGGAGTATFNAGTGGTAGDSTTDLPGFIRIFRVPT